MARPTESLRRGHRIFQRSGLCATLAVKRGEVMCLVGPSGSGKSTFLRCINHLERLSAGRLSVDGELIGYREANGKLYELHPKEAARQRRDIGMVFQLFNLFPHMTALENVMEAPQRTLGLPKAQAEQCQEPSEPGRCGRSRGLLPGASVRRAAAERGHCSCARNGAQAHALR
jgi:ABC-type histidine transport system ATPase subunit